MNGNFEHITGEPLELACGETTLMLGMLEPRDILIDRRQWAKDQIKAARREKADAIKEFASDLSGIERVNALAEAKGLYAAAVEPSAIDEFLAQDPSVFDYTLYLGARKNHPEMDFDSFRVLASQADQVDVTRAYMVIHGADVSRETVERMMEEARKKAEEEGETADPPAPAEGTPPKGVPPKARKQKKPDSSTTSPS